MHQIQKHAIYCVVIFSIESWDQSHYKWNINISQLKHSPGNDNPVSIYTDYRLSYMSLKSRENHQKNCHKITNSYFFQNLKKQISSLECLSVYYKVSHKSNQPSMSTASWHTCTILNLGRKFLEKRPQNRQFLFFWKSEKTCTTRGMCVILL